MGLSVFIIWTDITEFEDFAIILYQKIFTHRTAWKYGLQEWVSRSTYWKQNTQKLIRAMYYSCIGTSQSFQLLTLLKEVPKKLYNLEQTVTAAAHKRHFYNSCPIPMQAKQMSIYNCLFCIIYSSSAGFKKEKRVLKGTENSLCPRPQSYPTLRFH